MTFDSTQSSATGLTSSHLKWAFAVAAITLAACGGGGGDSPAAPPPVPPPAPPAVLNALEELAYQSWAVRRVTVDYVTDDDNRVTDGSTTYGGRLNFAGKYPAGTGTGGGTGSNLPPIASGVSGLCKDGGTKKQTDTLINNNNIYDVGESILETWSDCKDLVSVLNGTRKYSFKAPLVFYAAPNDKAYKSTQQDVEFDWAFTKPSAVGYINTYSEKGLLGVDINDQRRIYSLKDLTQNFTQGSAVGNTLIGINRSNEFGPDQPFSVAGFAGNVTIDGKSYTISSSKDIPWLKTYGYFPKSGSITATAANGDRVFTEFTATGAKCSLVPSGTTTASLTVEQCSKL
jgi:hypothetical protein